MNTSCTFELESGISGPVAGIDEAGRGPLAGPVVAAAVILDPDNIPAGIGDSKKLTEKRRDALAPEIYASAQVGVGIASVEEIDEINILQATMLAMVRAFENLPARAEHCLIDGNRAPDLPCLATPVVKGDATSLSIAAASIIAKTHRDQMMRALADKFPAYGWAKNKGYGAKVHLDALRSHGPSPHHRKSFEPIKSMLTAPTISEANG